MRKILLVLISIGVAASTVWAEPERDLSAIKVNLTDNASLLIADDQGQLTGVDPTIPKMYQDIPESNGGDVPFTRAVSIFHPQGTAYQLIVIGMNRGDYALEMVAYSQDGTPQPKITLRGDASPGAKADYDITFNRDWAGGDNASTMVRH